MADVNYQNPPSTDVVLKSELTSRISEAAPSAQVRAEFVQIDGLLSLLTEILEELRGIKMMMLSEIK